MAQLCYSECTNLYHRSTIRNNMKHRHLTLTFSFLIILLLNSCKQPKQYFEVAGMLHTPYTIKFEYTESLEDEIQAELQRYYHCLNPFDSTSIISQVNRNKEIEVDDLFVEVFNKAMEVSEQTNGIYDITCAPLINLWGFGFSKSDSITPAIIDSVRSFVGYRKVRLEGKKVVKDDPRLLLNCSSLGDGCSCEVIARLLDSKGIENYLIDIGGETTAKGVNPKRECWRIGITKPSDDPMGTNRELQEIVRLCGRHGLATSGDYRNFYIKDGKKYAHTIDPRTGYPAGQPILSATVIAPDCMTADAYATAFMAMGREEARKIQQEHPELEYLFIYADENGDYRTDYSDGFRQYFVSTE